MKITNQHELDRIIVDYIVKSAHPPKPERIGVTQLIGPPKIRCLTMKHYDNMEEDVSDRLWAIMGSSIHNELAKYHNVGVAKEFRMEVKAGIFTLVGIADIVDFLQKSIDDWKITSVWSVKFADHDEWEQQLNVYRAMLYMLTGMTMEKLRVHAIMRDWSRRDAQKDESYPQIQFRTIDIPVWPMDTAIAYIKERIELHTKAQQTEVLPDCTPEEMWCKPGKWAVMKKGNQTAYRVKDTKDEAEEVIKAAKKSAKDDKKEAWADSLEIVERPGECSKCKSFCPVKNFCNQAKALGYVDG